MLKMNFLKRLYDYQLESVEILERNDKGIVCLPTGTGKTYIQSASLAKHIINNKGFGIYVINAPRILLSYQLLREVYSVLINNHIDARYMCVHSGKDLDVNELADIRINSNKNSVDGIYLDHNKISSTTSPKGINEMVMDAKKQNLPLVLFSTYNSATRIEIGRGDEEIDIVFNDEAHYLIQTRFHDILNELTSKKMFFFTATLIKTPSDKGTGMNNVYKYGPLLKEMKPIEAIKMGKMLRPRLHFTKTTSIHTRQDLKKSMGYFIEDTFKQHEYVLNVSGKMVITTSGTNDIRSFMSSKEYERLMKKGVTIFAVSSSDDIGNDINGVKCSRQEWLKQLREMGECLDRRMIILHYDIIAEGIDVPGITGVLLLRSLNKSKFLQTYGRVARFDSTDKKLIEKGELEISDLESYNKPYGWIIVPQVLQEDEDNKGNTEELITEMRSYGFDPSEHVVVTSEPHGLPILEGLDALNMLNKKSPKITKCINKLKAEYEEERLANLTDNEWFNELVDI